MSVFAELHDGRRLEFPDGTDPAVIQATVKKVLGGKSQKPTTAPITPDQQRAMAVSATRGEHPVLAGVGDFLTGASGLLRGGLNAVQDEAQALGAQIKPRRDLSSLITGKQGYAPENLGDKLLPPMPGSENSGWRTAGEFADPSAWLLGGISAKAIPYAQVLGKGKLNVVKALLQNAIGGAATGGTIGGLSDHGDVKGSAGVGAIANLLLPPSLKAAGTGVGKVITALTPKNKAALLVQEVAGADLPALQAATKSAPAGLTAAQSAADVRSDTFNALGDLVQRNDRTSYFSRLGRQQEAERLAALSNVTPPLKESIEARAAASDPLYAAARKAGDVVDTGPVLSKIDDFAKRNVGNPELIRELARIKSGLLDEAGHPRVNSEQVASVMDGLKASIANKENKFILGHLVELKNDIANSIPGYQQAQAKFAEMSPPVNQSQVLGEMASVLQKPGGGERVGPFQNVLGRGEEAMLKRSTGYPRFETGDLPKVLTGPGQMDAVSKVAAELARNQSMAQGASAGEGGLFQIMGETGGRFQLPNWVSGGIALTNRALKEIETRVSKRTMAIVAEGMKTGAGANELLTRMPIKDRSVVIKALIDAQSSPMTRALMAGTISAGQQ